MNKKVLLASAIALVTLASCKDDKKTDQDQQNHGITLEYMDTDTKPGDDFFRYVNGTWYDKTEIPDDRTRWGSFDELRQNTDKDALAILKQASQDKNLDPNSDQAKAVAIYNTYLDSKTRTELGTQPIQSLLDQINAMTSVQQVEKLINELADYGGLGLYSSYVSADAKSSSENVVYLSLGSLGLPDKDYYMLDSEDMKEKRQQYVDHVTRMLTLAGEQPAEAAQDAKSVLEIETKLSEPRLTRVERRDARLTYNPMTLAELQKLAPVINWTQYFEAKGLNKLDKVIVSQPKYIAALNNILTQKNLPQIKAYLKWTLVNRSASILTPEMETANWEFYSKTLEGAKEQRPIEERALAVVNSSVGEALGQLYVEQKFPAEAKEKAKAMISNVISSFGERIQNLPWMAEETKKGALEKLYATTIKIGYPDKWEDYSTMEIKNVDQGGNYYDNMRNATKWGVAKNTSDYGKPVDKSRWGMSPQTVNAYFNPVYNEIVFPAAILQPPFYDYQADEAINYGGIGAVIGHEISHSFDDSGSRFDKNGNLNNWWTAEDLERFTMLGTNLADQYSELEPLPGVFVDGKFTLGENIGDLGGVNAAYDGLQKYLAENGDPGLIDGFTPEQRFFISWATIWRTKARDEAVRNQVKTDPHAPGHYRAYVPLQNVDAFYEAFDIQETDKLYIKPEERVKIW
ncbi:M13 family metallopeptidase [Myroides sp. LJL115]